MSSHGASFPAQLGPHSAVAVPPSRPTGGQELLEPRDRMAPFLSPRAEQRVWPVTDAWEVFAKLEGMTWSGHPRCVNKPHTS